MKILLTGVAGMIGSVLSRYFLDRGYEVIGIDNLSGGFKENLDPRVEFYYVDITNSKQLSWVFECTKPDYVIHLAAYAAEILSPFIRNFNYTNNVVGSVNVINSCINCNVKKLINFSSIATYGRGKPPFKETHFREPEDCYGIAKLAVEMDLKEAHEHFGLKYSTVLPHNVVSVYQNYFDRYRNVIAIFIRQVITGKDITIYGNGKQQRAFSDCKYLCDPIDRLLTSFDGEAFNIGSSSAMTILEAARLVSDVGYRYYGFKSDIVHLEPRKEVFIALSDHSKAVFLLRFKDETNLEILIKEMFKRALELRELYPNMEAPKMEYEITKKLYSYWK